MDMKISGSGSVSSGEYENIRISGSGRLVGFVRCASFHASGSAKGDDIDCKNELKVSGSTKFETGVRAGSVSVSGSFSCGGELCVQEKLSVSGSVKCGGSVKCMQLHASGAMHVTGDVEAERVGVSGILNCGGLLNGEEIDICFDRGMEIGSVGGSKIAIYPNEKRARKQRLALLSSLIKNTGGNVVVKGDIEGDSIALENVAAQRVSGRVVAIGEGCEIELVQYSEEVEISPDAKVGRTEKI